MGKPEDERPKNLAIYVGPSNGKMNESLKARRELTKAGLMRLVAMGLISPLRVFRYDTEKQWGPGARDGSPLGSMVLTYHIYLDDDDLPHASITRHYFQKYFKRLKTLGNFREK
jgi:hypothetical protein